MPLSGRCACLVFQYPILLSSSSLLSTTLSYSSCACLIFNPCLIIIITATAVIIIVVIFLVVELNLPSLLLFFILNDIFNFFNKLTCAETVDTVLRTSQPPFSSRRLNSLRGKRHQSMKNTAHIQKSKNPKICITLQPGLCGENSRAHPPDRCTTSLVTLQTGGISILDLFLSDISFCRVLFITQCIQVIEVLFMIYKL